MIRIAEIQRAVMHNFGVPSRHFFSPVRDWRVSHPRQVAMLLARELTDHSLPNIGRQFGRDHSTVISGIRRAQKRIANDPQLARKVASIRYVLIANEAKPNGLFAAKNSSTNFSRRSIADTAAVGA